MHMHIKFMNTFWNWLIDRRNWPFFSIVNSHFCKLMFSIVFPFWSPLKCRSATQFSVSPRSSFTIYATIDYMCNLCPTAYRCFWCCDTLPHPASSSPYHCWQPSIFGCWPSGVELSATVGYIGNWHRLWQPSTLDSRHFCSFSHIIIIIIIKIIKRRNAVRRLQRCWQKG